MGLQSSFRALTANTITQSLLPAADSVQPLSVLLSNKGGGWIADPTNAAPPPDWKRPTFDFHKKDALALPNDDFWLANTTGGDGNDCISGIGFLGDPSLENIAWTVPSALYGDLVYFQIDGGKGDDDITGANNADTLNGGDGNDHVYGLGGDDNVTGGNGDDCLSGDDGNDSVDGGAGEDKAFGGLGDDIVNGGDGDDCVDGGDGNDNLYGGNDDDHMYGGAGNDYMDGGDGNDCMVGGDGDDNMTGGNGDDDMSGGCGNDLILGGNGDDRISGGEGNDQLAGDAGNDCIFAGDGNDKVDGGAGNDALFGGDGADTISGGASGNDFMVGGCGSDVFLFCDPNVGSDEIEDFSTGHERDQIDVTLLGVTKIVVEATGEDNSARLDFYKGGTWMGEVYIESCQQISDVFDKDSTYGTGAGAIVRVAGGVVVDLPSMSVVTNDGHGMFF